MLDQFYNRQIETLIEELKSLRNQYNKLVLNEQENVVGPTFPVDPKTFDTILPPHEERKFRMFMGQIGRSVDENTRDYDMRGFYADHVTSEIVDTGSEEEGDEKYKFKIREGALTEKPKSEFEKPSEEEQKRLAGLDIIRAGKTQISPLALRVHFPDTYKKPNHPTFSTESRYHGVADSEGRVRMGGEWKMVENHRGEKNYTFTPHPTQIDSPEEESRLIRYFRAVEPHNTLIHPSSGEYLHHPYMTSPYFYGPLDFSIGSKSVKSQFHDYERAQGAKKIGEIISQQGSSPEGSISPEDFAQMRAERVRSYRVSDDKLTIPIPMDARFDYEDARGGGVPGRRTGILQTDIEVPVELRLADVLSGEELTSGKEGELEKMMASGVIERQMKRGAFAKTDRPSDGRILKFDSKSIGHKGTGYFMRLPGGKAISFADEAGMFRQLPDTSLKITPSEIEPLTAGTDTEPGGVINQRGDLTVKSPSNLPFTENPIDVWRYVLSDTHKGRNRGDFESVYADQSRRFILRPKEDLMKSHDAAIDEYNKHIEKYNFDDEEIDIAKRLSTEKLIELTKKSRSNDVITVARGSKLVQRFSPRHYRIKALRDLKFKMNKIDGLRNSIDNYDEIKASGNFDERSFDPTGADAESVRDLESKFDMQSLQPGDFARRRGELPIGREFPIRALPTDMERGYSTAFLRGVYFGPESKAEEARRIQQSSNFESRRMQEIQKELDAIELRKKADAESPYYDQGDSDRPYEPREVETGVDAATLKNLYKKKRKKAPTKAEKAAAEEASAVQQAKNRSIMQRAMGREEEARSTLGSRLSSIEGLTPSEIERLSAGSIRDVERMGTRVTRGDLQRDLAHRAAYRRQSIPLADRPDYLKYLGESVLRLSRARTIS